MRKVISFIVNLIPQQIAYTHCDIPCGVYDPHNAQLAAHTIIRMTQFLGEIKRDDETKAEHDIARVTHVKEKHSNLLEEELDTLQNDYFKDEHYKAYPDLEGLFKSTLKTATKARQGIDMEAAQKTLEGVQKIAEIFFKTKNVEPIRVKSVYPTGGEIVLHK